MALARVRRSSSKRFGSATGCRIRRSKRARTPRSCGPSARRKSSARLMCSICLYHAIIKKVASMWAHVQCLVDACERPVGLRSAARRRRTAQDSAKCCTLGRALATAPTCQRHLDTPSYSARGHPEEAARARRATGGMLREPRPQRWHLRLRSRVSCALRAARVPWEGRGTNFGCLPQRKRLHLSALLDVEGGRKSSRASSHQRSDPSREVNSDTQWLCGHAAAPLGGGATTAVRRAGPAHDEATIRAARARRASQFVELYIVYSLCVYMETTRTLYSVSGMNDLSIDRPAHSARPTGHRPPPRTYDT